MFVLLWVPGSIKSPIFFKLNKRNTYHLLLCEAIETKKHLQLKKTFFKKVERRLSQYSRYYSRQNGSSRRQLGHIREEKPNSSNFWRNEIKTVFISYQYTIYRIHVHIFNMNPRLIGGLHSSQVQISWRRKQIEKKRRSKRILKF